MGEGESLWLDGHVHTLVGMQTTAGRCAVNRNTSARTRRPMLRAKVAPFNHAAETTYRHLPVTRPSHLVPFSVPPRPSPSHPVPSHPIPSRPVPSRPVPSRPVPSRPDPSRPDPSRPTPSQLVPSRPVPSRPVPSRPVPTRPVPSRPVPSHPVPSRWSHLHLLVAASGDHAAGVCLDRRGRPVSPVELTTNQETATARLARTARLQTGLD